MRELNMGEVALESLYDSLKVLGLCLVIYVLLSFFETAITRILSKKSKLTVLLCSIFGVIPQCGISVVISDLYIKRHITVGALFATFIACSDEALPVLFASLDKWYMGFAVIGIKIAYGFIIGFLVDVFYTKSKNEVLDHENDCHHEDEVYHGCCHHSINDVEENKWHKHLIHPLLHSIKIFVFVFIINICFGVLVWGIGEDKISSFLSANKYLTPLLAAVVGIIPNCAPSVLLSDLYILNAIPFGALLSGLTINSGLGTLYLFKEKGHRKEALIILGVLFVASLVLGYAFIWVTI